jgi:hypothetical protein
MGRYSPRTAHHRDNGTKHLRFQQRSDQIPRPQRPARGLQNDADADSKDRVGQERRGGETEREADKAQDGEREDAGEDARDHEVVDGVGAKDAESVRLLRHLHGAELGGERGADAAGNDNGRDDRRELAREREGEDAADGAVEAEAGELAHELDGEGHADEGGGEERDPRAPGPNAAELRQEVAAVDAADEDAVEDLAREEQRREPPPDRARRGPPGEQGRRRGCGGRIRLWWRGRGVVVSGGGGREREAGDDQAAASGVEAEELRFGAGRVQERVGRCEDGAEEETGGGRHDELTTVAGDRDGGRKWSGWMRKEMGNGEMECLCCREGRTTVLVSRAFWAAIKALAGTSEMG